MRGWIPFIAVLTLANSAFAHEISEAQALYEKNCYVCHGAKGLGDGPAGKLLGTESVIHELEEHANDMDHLIEEVMEGKGVMPAWEGILTEQQVQAILDYLKSLQ